MARFPDLTPAEKQNGLVGLGHALRAVAALLLMCDPRDLGVTLTEDSTEPSRDYRPNLYLYDNYPGGIGGSEPLFRMQDRLLRSAIDLINGCPCEHGCPSCVGPGERGKEVARRVLREILAVSAEKELVAGV